MQFITFMGSVVIVVPAILACALGAWSLTARRLSETAMSRSVSSAIAAGLAASLGMLFFMLASDNRHVVIELGQWIAIPHYHFSLRFVFDRLSVPFVILSYLLCGTIGTFASRYMHRETGYNRFFVLYAVFLLGMVTTSLAGTIETLFAGWELVGLSSALLVAFFHERPAPVRNGLRVWTIYRFSDAALLMAALVLHHLAGEGNFDLLMGTSPWPLGDASVTETQALYVGLLLLAAAAGKSALVPFSGWLPRAMEGPTPSSAVFYGALSVHLGAFLLLRVSPILILSSLLCSIILALGAITALFGSLAERVQTDIKSALSFASLTQVGIIFAEIGAIGLVAEVFGSWMWYIPLVHLLGHATLRTLQFVRAPSLLQDYRLLENAIGERLPHPLGFWQKTIPSWGRRWFYRFALERGYLDALLSDYVARPFVGLFQAFDTFEQFLIRRLAGETKATPRSASATTLFDEL